MSDVDAVALNTLVHEALYSASVKPPAIPAREALRSIDEGTTEMMSRGILRQLGVRSDTTRISMLKPSSAGDGPQRTLVAAGSYGGEIGMLVRLSAEALATTDRKGWLAVERAAFRRHATGQPSASSSQDFVIRLVAGIDGLTGEQRSLLAHRIGTRMLRP